ncbi:MAG: TolC family protein [Fretibacterium sp.]|nr:TolC family protein [Fretibacterium sp.]
MMVLLWGVSASAEESMQFDKYLGLLEGSPSLQMKLKTVEAAYYSVLSGVSVQRPQVSVQAGASWLSGQDTAGARLQNIKVSSVALVLGQRIDISGTFSLDERQRILSYEIARADFCSSVNSLLSQGEELWWSALLARENVVLQKDVLRQRSENHRVTMEKFRQQLVPRLDIVRSEAQVVEAESWVKEAEIAYANLLQQLSFLAGGVEVVPADEELRVPLFDLGEVDLERALATRPDVRAAHLNLERARLIKKLMAKGKTPTLDFGLQWTPWAEPELSTTPQKGEVGASLQLKIPILDGNKTKYEILNADSLVQAAEQGVLSVNDMARRDVAVAKNNWKRAAALEQDKKLQVERSDEELRITELMYLEGMGAQIDLINAQTANQAVRTDYINAVKEMYVALVELRRVTGDYAPTEEGTWKEALIRYGKGEHLSVRKDNRPRAEKSSHSSAPSKALRKKK